ncbi:MAG: Wzz/FepE/Etk N-terminal domain-containing protein [Verrucomicrobiales bacterium]|nr:Wzz/FepE/Etk N-terminal domain-containing protein [Verrucomicrobiales bacterium]
MVDVRDLRGIVRRRFLLLLLIPLLTVVAALAYLFFGATHYYESSALIYVDPRFDRILQIENVSSFGSDLDSLNSLEQAIVSDSMILRVVDKLGLRNDTSFLPRELHKYAAAEEPVNSVRLLKYIRKRYQASLVRPTRNIYFVAYDTNAQRAQLIAKTFVSEFEAFLGEQKRGEAGDAKTGLRAQALEAYRRALEAEKELNRFRENHPGVVVEQDHNLVAESLSKAGEELQQAKSEVVSLRSKVEAIKNIDPTKDPGKIIAVGSFSDLEHVSDLMSERTTARANFAVVLEQYTPRHPKYIEAANRVREIDSQMARLADDFKSALLSNFEAATDKEKELRERVTSLQKQLNEVKNVSSEFRAVKQKVETEWSIHEQLQKKIGDTTLSAEKSTSVTKLWSEPMVGYKTTNPKKSIVVIVAALLGCLGSFVVVTTDLFRDGPFSDKSQIEDTMKVPVVAQLSRNDLGAYSQEMTRAMAQIILRNQHEGCQIFHVINSDGNSKVSSKVAAGLANISAYYRAETILIRTYDAGPSGIFHLSPVETETKGLYRLDIPSSLLLADNALHLLSSQCQNFKRVIIDSSEMAADSQLPVYFGRFSQQNIFVVDRKADTKARAMKSAEHFRAQCPGALSVVLVG